VGKLVSLAFGDNFFWWYGVAEILKPPRLLFYYKI